MVRISETERGIIASTIVFSTFILLNLALAQIPSLEGIHEVLQTSYWVIPLAFSLLSRFGFFICTKQFVRTEQERHIDIMGKILEEDKVKMKNIILATRELLRIRSSSRLDSLVRSYPSS